MWYTISIILLIFITLFIIYCAYYDHKNTTENFNEQSGRFCPTCANKTINQCLRCFNCGWCVDKYGNSGCIGGDSSGPYNAENCARWYYIDGFTYMTQRNNDYKCSYGPRSSNRLIGV